MVKKVKLGVAKKTKTKKLSLAEIVWFGFNYTAGITFTAVFGSLLYGEIGANLGTHMIWIFLVEGLIAGTCAWAFSRLSQVHPGSNGAAYIYTRSTYGRFWGWMVAFIQYATIPVIITAQIISMIRINFTGSIDWLTPNWGVWTNLGLDLIGILVYVLISCVLFLGMRAFKIFVNISSYVKWITTALLLIALIVLFAMTGTDGYKDVVAKQSININSFSKAFTTCFFFFLGFETYATIGKNVKNPQKNISRAIVIVMLLATLFYVLVTILMIGSAVALFEDNPNLQIFKWLGNKIGAKLLSIAGVIIMVICTVSLKANSQMQNALYGGAILEPLSYEGYIPSKFKDLNKDKIPYRAAILNLIVSTIFAVIYLIVPDLVQAISDNAAKATKPTPAVLDFGKVMGQTSLIMIIIFICVIIVALRLSFTNKIRHNKIEIVCWILAVVFLLWQFVMWFVNLANDFILAGEKLNSSIQKDKAAGLTLLVSSIVQIAYLVIVFIFALSWYYLYYNPKLQKRLSLNTQKELDSEFQLQDDWPFVAKNLQIEVENYMKRNLVNNENDTNNKNYKFATKIRKELINSEGEWKEPEDK